MKKQSHTKVIHIWNDYDFTLYIPSNLKGFNKPHISFNYKNENTGKKERIKKFIRKHKGDLMKINLEAKKVALDLVKLLENHWNPISKSFGEVTLSPLATVKDCIQYYLQAQAKSFDNQAIGFQSLKNTKILMMHFSDYIRKKNLLLTRLDSFTNIHIKEFLDSKGFEKGWGKVTYNTYLVNTGSFFNYFKDLKFLSENPCKRVSKKNIKFDTSRFMVFEKEELHNVATLLVSDKTYSGLYLATKLLYKYNIRPIEITRIRICDFDFDKSLLTLDSSKTKNHNEAKFKLDQETLDLIKEMTTSYNPEFFLFGGRNKPGKNQVCAEYFGQCWRYFRKRHNISNHLKLYALKHTSNYYDIEAGASFEEIRQRNRHANLQITTLYIKERLFKNEIKASTQDLF